MESDTRELVIQELDDLPDPSLFEVLDFVRFLKSQWGEMSPEERFDRAWMIARRVATKEGISDSDIRVETDQVRHGQP